VVLYSFYVQLLLFKLVFYSLLRSLTKSQTFNPDWPELGHTRAERDPNGEKTWFSRAEINIT